MQTLTEIREILTTAGLSPLRRLGQNFMVDKNLMAKLLETAALTNDQTVLEVGAGTGSLTEELIAVARRVVAVEIDRGLCRYLSDAFGGRENLKLICGDVLAGKHAISPEVLAAIGGQGVLVANLPYSIVTPLIAQCLIGSWRSCHGQAGAQSCRFDRMTFTVQNELAERLAAAPGGGAYGPVSVLVALLGKIVPGPAVPASAFWPRPKVASRIMRIDFDDQAAMQVADIDVLTALLALAFGQRRKQIGSIVRRKDAAFPAEAISAALGAVEVDTALRPEQIDPETFAAIAARLAETCRPSQ